MGLLTREQIVAANDLPSEVVAVPEWGGDVRVRTLTATERDKMSLELMGADGKPNFAEFNLRLVAAAMVDESDNPYFGQDEIEALGRKSSLALQRVTDVAQRLNGITEDKIQAAEGNSAGGQSAGSSTDGPALSAAPLASS